MAAEPKAASFIPDQMRLPRLRCALSLLAFAAPIAGAQGDSSRVGPLFTYRDAIFAAGVVATARLIHPLDDYFAQRLQDSSTQANAKLQSLAVFVRTTTAPGSFIIGGSMYAVGRLVRTARSRRSDSMERRRSSSGK